MTKPTIDLTGQRFGRLTVLRRGENALRKDGRNNATFVCQCDCGNVSDIKGFVNVVSPIAYEVHLTDGNNLTVSAKSILGAMYTMEWSEVYCTCDKDIYRFIQNYVLEE